jgi:hypothetical protein
MFLYPENYAKKGPNDVISFINFFVNQLLENGIKVLHIFSDNSFSQNKNKFLWAYFKHLVVLKRLENVIIYYPIVGHSLMEIDGHFGRIKLNKRNYQRIYHPSEYARIIKNINIKNPINVFSANHSLFSDNSQIVKVLDYKKKLSPILKNQLNHCSCVRKITFTEKGIKISLTLSEDFEQSLELFKPNFDQKLLNSCLEDLQLAYQKFLPISREKLYDNDEQCSSIWCSVVSTSTEQFNFSEPEHALEHLTLEHRARALSTWP